MSGGVEGRRWPPVLNSVEECYHYTPMQFFLTTTFPFESDPLRYPFHDVLPPELCSRFLRQVRNSWGYDVNVVPPHSPLIPISKILISSENDVYQKHILGDCMDLVSQINNLVEEHGKFYEFDQLKNAVDMPGYRYLLITFTVREVSSGKLERVRVCYFDRTVVQWFFEDKEDEDEDEDEGIFFAAETSRGWLS